MNCNKKGDKRNTWERQVRFADHIAIIAEKENDLENNLCRMDRTTKTKGIKLNKNKTKIMIVSKSKNINSLDLKMRKIEIMLIKNSSI